MAVASWGLARMSSGFWLLAVAEKYRQVDVEAGNVEINKEAVGNSVLS